MTASNNIILLGTASQATVEEKWQDWVFVVGVEAVEVLLGALWASALSKVQANCEQCGLGEGGGEGLLLAIILEVVFKNIISQGCLGGSIG